MVLQFSRCRKNTGKPSIQITSKVAEGTQILNVSCYEMSRKDAHGGHLALALADHGIDQSLKPKA